MKTAFLLGRLVFGGFFINAGINHIQHRRELSEYASAKKVPMPEVAVTATGVMLIVGGTSILLGAKPKLGTLAIMGFLAGVSPVMHDFWAQGDPSQRQNEMIHFMKNLAMLGAATALLGVEEPWPASVRVGQPKPHERIKRAVRKVAA